MVRRSGEYPQLLDETWLRAQYVDGNRAASDIARELGCGTALVHYRLRDFGIPRRGRHPGRWHKKSCERCQNVYTPSSPAQRFCSPACRLGTKACEQCGEEFVLRPPKSWTDKASTVQSYRARFCSFECQTAWRSANCSHRYMNDEGYVVIVRPPSEHRGINDNGYVRLNLGTGRHGRGRVLEHRHVMEQKLGRQLLPDETVHHINGVKTDNRPENLELWVSKHPRGQRVEDIVEYATEMLRRYAPARLAPQP